MAILMTRTWDRGSPQSGEAGEAEADTFDIFSIHCHALLSQGDQTRDYDVLFISTTSTTEVFVIK